MEEGCGKLKIYVLFKETVEADGTSGNDLAVGVFSSKEKGEKFKLVEYYLEEQELDALFK